MASASSHDIGQQATVTANPSAPPSRRNSRRLSASSDSSSYDHHAARRSFAAAAPERTSSPRPPPRRSSVGSASLLEYDQQQLRDRAGYAASTANTRNPYTSDPRSSSDPFGHTQPSSDPAARGSTPIDHPESTSRPLSRLSMASGRSIDESAVTAPTSQPRSRARGGGGGDDDDDGDDDDGGFVRRKRDRHTNSTILPPAGFFAPRKPNARPGAVSPNVFEQSRSRSPFAHLDEQQRSPAPAPYASRELYSAHHQPETPFRSAGNSSNLSLHGDVAARGGTRSSSPWGFSGSVQSLSSATHIGSHAAGEKDKDPHAATSPQASYRTPNPDDRHGDGPGGRANTLKMAASTDPLIPATALRASGHARPARAPEYGSPEYVLEAMSRPGLQGLEDQSYTLSSEKGHLRHRPDSSGGISGGAGAGTSPGPTRRPASSRRQSALAAGQQARRDASSVSITIPPTSLPRKRNYSLHGGSNRFFCRGLVMTSGGNPLAFISSVVLALVLGGLFFGFEAKWLADNISPAVVAVFAYVYALTLVNMLVTAWKDPGVVPRDLDPDPPCTLGEAGPADSQPLADPSDPLAIPVQRVIRIRGQDVRVKWCETCGTYRPPRSSHCRVCDNCVENIDHHCDYLNTCIGRRNYVSFMVFLLAAIVSALMVLGLTAAHLVLLTRRDEEGEGNTLPRGKTFREALGETPVSAVLFLLTLMALGPITALFVYHLRLVLLNRTTVEQIRITIARECGEQKTYSDDGRLDEDDDDDDSIYRSRTNAEV